MREGMMPVLWEGRKRVGHGCREDVGSLRDNYAANMAMASDVSGQKRAAGMGWCVPGGGWVNPFFHR
jgi:hypothetical protein